MGGESVPLPVRILESVKNTPRWVLVAARSFLLFVFGLCATVYLQRRSSAAVSAVFLLRPIIQLLVVSLAWVSCCTRISDNVHHWGDVVVGMALGATAALWSCSASSRRAATLQEEAS